MEREPDSPPHATHITPGKRALAWGVLLFGSLGAVLAATIIVVDGKWLPSAALFAFCVTLVIDRALYLRGVYSQRHQLPAWNGIYIVANLLMTGSLFLNFALDKHRGGLGLLAAAGAVGLSLLVLLLAILMSGASWRSASSTRRS